MCNNCCTTGTTTSTPNTQRTIPHSAHYTPPLFPIATNPKASNLVQLGDVTYPRQRMPCRTVNSLPATAALSNSLTHLSECCQPSGSAAVTHQCQRVSQTQLDPPPHTHTSPPPPPPNRNTALPIQSSRCPPMTNTTTLAMDIHCINAAVTAFPAAAAAAVALSLRSAGCSYKLPPCF